MGVVYACRDTVTGDRVALKLLQTADGTPMPGYAAWFWAEARALASLDHPCIVRGRDFGTLGKAPYLVMDLVPGLPLTSLLAEVDLDWPAIWIIADKVLGALAHAHARGIIHGDLKHTNIMVDVEPGDLRVGVLDFGLAWLLRDRFDHRIDGTAPEGPMLRPHAGTVGWMAPEQIRGAVPHVGPWTDLYALGCILFHLLTGHEPYESNDLDELQRMHRNAPVPELKLASDVPAGVAPFVRRLLAKRPWHRYAFASDARGVLAQYRPTGERSTWKLPPRPDVPDASVRPAPAPRSRPVFEIAATDTAFAGMITFGPTRFVGRDHEKAQLRAMCDQIAVAPLGTQRVVLLTGQPGVGKSRIAEWVCEDSHERGVAIPLRARHHKLPTPLDGMIGAVMAHYGVENADRAMTERALMNVWEVSKTDEENKRWVAAVGEWLRPTAPGRPSIVGPTGQRFVINTEEISWTVMRHVLERIGWDRPLLLWLDDIHLASARDVDWLERLANEHPNFRMLVVATMVTEGAEVDAARVARVRQVAQQLSAIELEVPPLGEQETGQLLLSSITLDETAVHTAVTRSRGIPLFALQLVHAWANGGSLEFHDGSYHVKPEAMGAVPATTAALWDERVSSLAPDVQLAAMAASALGGDIRSDVLVPLLTSLHLHASSALHRLEQAQILSRPDANRYRWAHMMLQEHLLTKLRAREDAARIFRETAYALGSYHPAAGTRRIVRHRVNNLILAGDLSEAVRVMLDFVERSWERTRDVAATLDDLSMIDGLARGAWAASHKRWKAEALRHAARFDEAMSLAFSARRAFAALNDSVQEAHCLRLLGHIASEKGAPRDGRHMVVEAQGMMEALRNEIGRAQCDVVLGELDYLLGQYDQAKVILLEAIGPFERANDHLGKGQCQILLALIAIARGETIEARKYLLDARKDFDRIGYRLGTAQCDIALAHADHRSGELEAARARAQNAFASFQLLGTPRGQAGALRLMAMASLDGGDLIESEKRAREALALYERMGDPWGIVECRLLIAQLSLVRGTPDARQLVEECDVTVVQEREPVQHWHLTHSWLAYREGRFDAAAAQLEAARTAMTGGLGDHAKQLFARMAAQRGWPEELRERVRLACDLSSPWQDGAGG